MIKYHRTEIREFYGFRENTMEDAQEITEWLCQNVLYNDHEFEHLKANVYRQFRELKIVPPSPDRIERLPTSENYDQITFNELKSDPGRAGVDTVYYREIIIEKDEKDQERINRINYEISAIQMLRDKLRCKEIWVTGCGEV